MALKISRKLFMEPTKNEWESRGVFNPTVIKKRDIEFLIYRGLSKKYISSLGYAKIKNDEIIERSREPLLYPTEKYEKKGIEDPRITKIGNTYYMIYVAFDGVNARVAYAVSKNLKDWKKKGIISPNITIGEARKLVKIKKYRDQWERQEVIGPKTCLWDKDAVLFPEKIKGKYLLLHRFLPDIQIVKFRRFEDLKDISFWKDYIINLSEEDKVSLYRRYKWESSHIGAGTTPIKTRYGWLIIYHGAAFKGKKNLANTVLQEISDIFHSLREKRLKLVYSAGAALLDLKRPEIEITRLRKPLFKPQFKFEREGNVNNVVFPEGAVLEKDTLKIYYGCADKRIGLAKLSFKGLLEELRRQVSFSSL
ncbi:pesticidal protein Cry7Aa [Candidatus Pacearchaeota archaeon]|nr:MAG: pesticidal protein Cry7Aa [Candidatus Pacearchaeota archaeon]